MSGSLDHVSEQNGYLSPRERFREDRQRKQNLAFASVLSFMTVALFVSLLIVTGIVKLPFDDSFNAQVRYAEAGTTPCPVGDAEFVEPSTIQVRVLNGTSRIGIAGEATTFLQELGFSTQEPTNAETYPGAVEINAGPRAVNEAWTVARFFPEARVKLTNATDRTVTVTLGSFYDVPIQKEEAATRLAERGELEGSSSCLLVDPDMLKQLESAGQSEDTPESGSMSGGQSEGAS